MSETDIIDVLRQYLWVGVWIASPLLLTALAVGVIVGLFQALTSIQELTLTFVPKLIAMVIAFSLCASFSAKLMLSLFQDSLVRFIAG